MDVSWETDFLAAMGNMIGYSRVNMGFKAALANLGVKMNGHGAVSMQVLYPEKYYPVRDRVNVLVTMFESEVLPDFFVESLDKADVVIVPSEYCARVFRNHTDTPVYVVPLGVDHSVFHHFDRIRESGRPFRWLWAGARNPRKGWHEVVNAWFMDGEGGSFASRSDCELFIKTLGDGESLRKEGNVITCSQPVSDDEMARIYADADAFVFPTQGEGFGWTAIEAQATGLPCVMPLHTGMLDWADETTCIPLSYEEGGYGVMPTHGGETYPIPLLSVNVGEVRDKMEWVMRHPEEASKIALRGMERVKKYTWESAGRTLLGILMQLEVGSSELAVGGMSHGNATASSQDARISED